VTQRVQSKCASSVQHGSAAPGARRLRCPQGRGHGRTAHGTWSYRTPWVFLTGLPTSLPAPDRNTRTLSFYLHTYNVNAPSGGQARQGPQTHSIHSRTPSVHSDTRPGPNQRLGEKIHGTSVQQEQPLTVNRHECTDRCHTSLTTCTLPIGVFYLLTYPARCHTSLTSQGLCCSLCRKMYYLDGLRAAAPRSIHLVPPSISRCTMST
jgi:hypothetical protein